MDFKLCAATLHDVVNVGGHLWRQAHGRGQQVPPCTGVRTRLLKPFDGATDLVFFEELLREVAVAL